jgi:hypothetical protein
MHYFNTKIPKGRGPSETGAYVRMELNMDEMMVSVKIFIGFILPYYGHRNKPNRTAYFLSN